MASQQSIQKLQYPTPPPEAQVDDIESANSAIKNISKHLKSLALHNDQLTTRLTNGFLVEGESIESLSVDKLTAGTIGVDSIYLFDDKFHIDGINQKITIKDGNDTTRAEFGSFGTGTSYGLKVWNSSGDVIIDLTGLGTDVVDNPQIKSGAVTGGKIANATITNTNITNSTITGAKIANSTIGSTNIADAAIVTAKIDAAAITTAKIANAAITNALIANLAVDTAQIANAAISDAKISDLSAGKIDAGTLTANASPVSIEVTGAGALLFSSGGDAIFRPNTTDASVIRFQSSGGSTVGEVRTLGAASSPTGIAMIAQGTGDDATLQSNSGDVNLVAGGNLFVNATSIESSSSSFQFVDHLEPSVDNTKEVGTPTRAWSDMHSYSYTTETGIEFGNMSFITEPYNVWSEQVMADNGIEWDEGLVVVTNDNVPRVLMGKKGLRTDIPPSDIDDPAVKKWKSRPEWFKHENGKFTKRMKRNNGRWMDDKGKIYSELELREMQAKWEGKKLTAKQKADINNKETERFLESLPIQ